MPDDQTPLPLVWVAGGPGPVAVMRSAWGDPRALFVAVKGGTPNTSHGHMDIGGFVFEADGVRWAVDLAAESYPKMRAAGLDLWNYRQDSSRWATFRIGPEGHNILRFNGARQQVDGRASVRNASMPGEPAVVIPGGHPNAPTHGHLKFPHPDRAERDAEVAGADEQAVDLRHGGNRVDPVQPGLGLDHGQRQHLRIRELRVIVPTRQQPTCRTERAVAFDTLQAVQKCVQVGSGLAGLLHGEQVAGAA